MHETASIETTLHYRNPDYVPGDERTRRDPRRVRIHDARPLADRLSLDSNGFILWRQRTAVTDFYDEDQIGTRYRPEVERWITQLTGAERVLTFRWKLRTSAAHKPDPRQEGPAEGVHVDYDLPTVRVFLESIVGAEEAARLRDRRLLLVNVWRGITPVERKPLALCDARTVSPGDLRPSPIRERVPGTAVGSNMVGRQLWGYNLIFNPEHRWYYFPRLQPDEALVFKLCDSDAWRPQLVAHSAIDDPTSAPAAPDRESFEMRTIAIMPAHG
jgi:hypothetical protein